MNVIVIGSGAREHAICRLIHNSPLCDKLYCFPGNYGISQIAECHELSSDQEIIEKCKKIKPDLVIIGPEDYLSRNLAGKLRKLNLNVFGPDSVGAQLESSKEFMKNFCSTHGIPTASSKTFTSYESAKSYLENKYGSIVVKYDGLAAGKGVFVCENTNDAIEACKKIFLDKIFNNDFNKVVIEDFIKGKELSFFTISDGTTALNFGSAQDYKRIGENDRGPNTGGMGTLSPAPLLLDKNLEEKIQKNIVDKTIDGLKKDKIDFQGVIFFGVIVDEFNNPFLLEYNTRFGDPEIQSISMRLKTDFLPLVHATATKSLKYANLEFFDDKRAVCLILATQGYPDSYPMETEIKNLHNFRNENDFYIFHAATKIYHDKILTTGGRVLSVVSLGDTYADCRSKVYEVASKIDWNFKYFRKDIGSNF